MGQYLNIGNRGFETIIRGNYVDKTSLIAYINSTLGTTEKLTCVSRPRRFGKSFAAKMLCAYYDKSCNSEQLFSKYKIAQDPSFKEHLNKYDVLYLDMTWFISITEDKKLIVKKMQEKVIEEIRKYYPKAERVASLPETLAKVNEITGERFIIIIDEWDALFREAQNDEDLQKEYIQLLRGLFKSSGQTDRMIEAAYMTGILPIKKYGTQSAMTDFQEYSMINPEPLEEYVGFTEEEVKKLCENSSLSFEQLQKWYDGYVLGEKNIHIYSPKSVMDALKRERLGNYWTQSETYESLKTYIDMDEEGLREDLVQMLGGAKIELDVQMFQNDMITIKGKDDIFTLLIHLGYLAYYSRTETVMIPNEEVRKEFIRALKRCHHHEIIQLIKDSAELLKDTICMNETAVANALEKAHSAGTAPLFYNNEQALRSVIRFAYIYCIEEYQMIQELPGGTGYADVVFIPKKESNKPALVIELKWNKTADSAIQQIKKNCYPKVLEGLTNEILLIGVNYHEKSKVHTCQIEKWKP